MDEARYSEDEHDALARRVREDGYVVLRQHFPKDMIEALHAEFVPLLANHVAPEGHLKIYGANRHYVTLPFIPPFADPKVFEDDDIVAIVDRLVGPDAVLFQLATDTPVRGSEHQAVHRDAVSLFPELDTETPPFQLVVDFPFVDVTRDNGASEIAVGTHMLTDEQALRALEEGRVSLEPVLMERGDVMIRDARALHRGTPNRTDEPRPMAIVGYSRSWLHRPEVAITIPRVTYDHLSPRARRLLRYEPVVETLDDAVASTGFYQSYAY